MLERSIYIGVLVPTHRGLEVLLNLSPSRLHIIANMEKSGRGYIWFKRIALTGMNSDLGLTGYRSGFTAGMGRARLLGRRSARRRRAVGPLCGLRATRGKEGQAGSAGIQPILPRKLENLL
jgi:hypothetical protein